MVRSFVIWGCAGHAKVLVSMIAGERGKVTAFFDREDVPSIVTGVPVYRGEDGFEKWAAGRNGLSKMTGLVAIGGHRGRDRMRIHGLFRRVGLNLSPLIHRSAFVCPTARLGDGSQVLAQAIVAADAETGAVCIINHAASVDHECRLGDGVHLAPGARVCGCVTIGDNVMIGAGAIVLPRLTIGPDALIGAGAVVTKDVPPGSVIMGNPGRPRQSSAGTPSRTRRSRESQSR